MSPEDDIKNIKEICDIASPLLSVGAVDLIRQMISYSECLLSGPGVSGWISLVNDLEKLEEADFEEEVEEVKEDLSWVLEDISYICEYTRKAKIFADDLYFKLSCLNITSDDDKVILACIYDLFLPFFGSFFGAGGHSVDLALSLCPEDTKELFKEIISNYKAISGTIRQVAKFLEAKDKKPLPTVFGTLREKHYYKRAIDAGLMTMNDNPGGGLPAYTWGGKLVRLAYFADKVYSGAGRFPASDLERLFGVRNLKQVRYRMNEGKREKWMNEIDNLLGLP